ncbi:hypothetical protein H6F76_13800 [Leptolyngbya sp. FACHB-321]|uniref:hypothetical protein n=1 Tax=Leptolyngbya sp. FACHB-321 TaxID=2692807 RepID=UPI0016885773|nr:hypothetical protein [Leptolyngbya sp. FACHB-321]MBD2036093.1 hypothetical protein [Leptolyngbya sp. FACHB-321]
MTSATIDLSTMVPARIGGSVQTYQWRYQGQEFPIVYETQVSELHVSSARLH